MNSDGGTGVANYNFEAEIITTDPISSQLIKYLSNTYLPLRLSFANEAARLVNSSGGNLEDVFMPVFLFLANVLLEHYPWNFVFPRLQKHCDALKKSLLMKGVVWLIAVLFRQLIVLTDGH